MSLKCHSQGHWSPVFLWKEDALAFSISREAGSGVEKCGQCVLGVTLRQDLQCPGPQPVLPILKMLHVF